MKSGILYVIFNKWIRDPETGKTPYTIGITRGGVYRKHYGIDIKIPGNFEAAFAYQFDDYAKCERAKQVIYSLSDDHHKNGGWFYLDENKIALIEMNCESLGGKSIAAETENGATNVTKEKSKTGNENDKPKAVTGESINIKGIEIALYKKEHELTQDFVKRTLHLMFDNDLLPETEIRNMLDKDYSKKTFGLSLAILQDDETKLKDDQGHNRYWVKEIVGNKYYVCSQWWKQHDSVYRSKLSEWIRKIAGLNETSQKCE